MSQDVAQFVRQAVTYRQTRLFIAPEIVYPTVRAAVRTAAGSQGIAEIDADVLDPEAACEQFRTAGRAGNVILIKAFTEVGPLEAMVYVWHQSGGRYDTGCGDLLKGDGTTDGSDRTKEGCVVVLFVTPEAYRRMSQSTLQRVYPPKDAYYFRSAQERSWDIFKR